MLTKEQVKILKTVTSVSARLIESNNSYPTSSTSELQLTIARYIGNNRVENTLSLPVDSRVSVYDDNLKDQPLKGFAYDERPLLEIIKKHAKVGDILTLKWNVGSHTNELLREAGLASDSLELIIRHGNQDTKYLVAVETSKVSSSARMVQIGKYDLDPSRLMI